MNRRNWVGLSAVRLLRLPIAFILLVFVGRGFDADAQTETNLYSFGSQPNDGVSPYAALVQGSDGNFYGTTLKGGSNNSGTVFRISSSGTYTTLHQFGSSPTDGAKPYAGLVQGRDGNFYGTTAAGGTWLGTVFRISPSGTYTTLHQFADGADPWAPLVQGSDGNFYGTTIAGGNAYGDGTVFRISPSGDYTNIYLFGGSRTNGGNSYYGSYAGLVQGSDGNFYGRTYEGGSNNMGTVFRISSSGIYTDIYQFAAGPNGGPNSGRAGLVVGSDGNFYGTIGGGTNSCNCGTVFRISPSGSYTTLYSFTGSPSDGAFPNGLVQGSDGNFYGTTMMFGGTNNHGNIFRISPGGSCTSLYQFAGYPFDGAGLLAGLIQGSDGNFYGTTYYGGTNNEGTVFRFSVPLNPPPWPINQITAVQPSGSDMVLNVVSIASETYQLQFSSSMSPTNWVNVDGVSVTNSIGALLILTNFGGAIGPQGFYRFAITP